MFYRSITASALLAALSVVSAQTSTSCNPLTASCPSDPGLAAASLSTDFTQGASSNWSPLTGTSLSYSGNGVEFTISADGQAPTMQSNFYIFFGRVDVVMKAAPGTGIVSSIVLESDDLDEIDWEFLGGDTTQGQTNFFGKGDISTYDRGAYTAVNAPQSTYHTYSIDWTTEQIQWLVDGAVVRTLPYSSSLAKGGAEYPQTPMRVKLGSWVGGGANSPPGTVQWAGGKTDFSQAPFNMFIKSIQVTNYNPASSYSYGDHSGSWQSIQKSGALAVGSPAAAAVTSTSSTSSVPVQTSLTTVVPTTVGPIVVPVQSTTSTSSTSTSSSKSTTSSATTAPLTTTAVVTASASSGFVSSTKAISSSASTTTAPAVQTGSAASIGVTGAGSLLSLAALFFLF